MAPPGLKRWDFWFGVIGVLGTIFGVYAYFATNKVGRISYAYDTQKVFDPANLSGFTLTTPDKVTVDLPVYATEIAIWNSGDFSLTENSDRIREPLKISLDGTIHYFIIGKVNVVDQSNFQIVISADKKNVLLKWKFFDPGQGIRFTLLHSDNAKPQINLTGRFFETSIREDTRMLPTNRSSWLIVISVIVSMLIFEIGMFLWGYVAAHRALDSEVSFKDILLKTPNQIVLFFISIGLGALSAFVTRWYLTSFSLPPV